MWKCWGLSLHIYGIRTLGERVVGRGHSGTLQVYLEGRFELESAQQLDTASRDQEPVLWWGLMFSHSVMSNSLQPHGLRHARLSCPSQSPGVCSNMSIEYDIQPSYPLSPSSPYVLNLSQHFFSSKSTLCIMWPKYWSFSFTINPSYEY